MADLARCAEVAKVLPGRFVFAALRTYEGFRRSRQAATSICYCIDNALVYEPFFADFGPLNLGLTYRFCQQTAALLEEAQRGSKLLCYFCGPTPEAKANAAVLVLMLGRTPDLAYQSMKHMEPFLAFRDASSGAPCFGLTVLNTIEGLARAQLQGLLDLRKFDLADYELNEKIENGDSSWILPGKLLAFSGPADVAESFYGYKTKVPEDYWKYFKEKGVTAVVRLNKPLYKASRFTAGGFQHYELYFPDGSCPSEALVDRFLSISEGTKGALAIHCKAGLGRTGVLICCYLMKHCGFSATEALGYIRVCRPGSVIGPQQNWVLAQQSRMHAAGAERHKARGDASPPGTPQKNGCKTVSMQLSPAKPAPQRPRSIRIMASCQTAEMVHSATVSVTELKIEPQAPVTPVQTTTSRLSALLRFKPPLIKALTGRSAVARAVAPNGQPRKIPAALLAAGEDGLKAFAADEDQPNSAKGDHWTITTSRVGDQAPEIFSPLAAALQHNS